MMGRFESLAASKWLRYGLVALSGLTILVLVFSAGFAFGRMSAFPVGPFSVMTRRGDIRFKSGHGVIGLVQSIEGQRITVQSRDGKFATILVNSDTKFDRNFEKILFADLKLNDQVIVIGSPNENGEINARLIGLIDPSTFRFPIRNVPFPTKSK